MLKPPNQIPGIQEPAEAGTPGSGDGTLCFDRDITDQTIADRETCFMHEPKITGTITIQGDGTMLVL